MATRHLGSGRSGHTLQRRDGGKDEVPRVVVVLSYDPLVPPPNAEQKDVVRCLVSGVDCKRCRGNIKGAVVLTLMHVLNGSPPPGWRAEREGHWRSCTRLMLPLGVIRRLRDCVFIQPDASWRFDNEQGTNSSVVGTEEQRNGHAQAIDAENDSTFQPSVEDSSFCSQ